MNLSFYLSLLLLASSKEDINVYKGIYLFI
jgi:hypothetical protein